MLQGHKPLKECLYVLVPGIVCYNQLVKEVVKAEQKLEELEVELPALLSNSHRDGDNYHTLAQRANAVFETRKEVGSI